MGPLLRVSSKWLSFSGETNLNFVHGTRTEFFSFCFSTFFFLDFLFLDFLSLLILQLLRWTWWLRWDLAVSVFTIWIRDNRNRCGTSDTFELTKWIAPSNGIWLHHWVQFGIWRYSKTVSRHRFDAVKVIETAVVALLIFREEWKWTVQTDVAKWMFWIFSFYSTLQKYNRIRTASGTCNSIWTARLGSENIKFYQIA